MTKRTRRAVGLVAGLVAAVLVLAGPVSAQSGGGAKPADPVTGEWNGEASVQGQPMPITLTLKLDGEVVTGEITSAIGKVPLTSGSWKEGVLTISFPYSGGEPVNMVAKIDDGKLTGMFDYNGGEMQGTWTAVRK